MTIESYTARFTAYARSIGMEPQNCRAGSGFFTFIRDRLNQWRTATGKKGALMAEDHTKFDEWLKGQK